MSLYDYRESIKIASKEYGFYSLIMAAMRQADDNNLIALQTVFPHTWGELKLRYNAPGGYLEGENNENKQS